MSSTRTTQFPWPDPVFLVHGTGTRPGPEGGGGFPQVIGRPGGLVAVSSGQAGWGTGSITVRGEGAYKLACGRGRKYRPRVLGVDSPRGRWLALIWCGLVYGASYAWATETLGVGNGGGSPRCVPRRVSSWPSWGDRAAWGRAGHPPTEVGMLRTDVAQCGSVRLGGLGGS